MKPFTRLSIGLLAGSLLSACATTGHNGADVPSLADNNHVDGSVYGRVESIQVSKIAGSDDPGMGTVIGGLVGGLIANQIASGNGRTLATVAGTGGGALIGYQFDQTRQHEVYKIRVQLDSGAYQTVSQDNDTDLSIGNRVHIDNGHLYRY